MQLVVPAAVILSIERSSKSDTIVTMLHELYNY
jgi:hypothetical protein